MYYKMYVYEMRQVFSMSFNIDENYNYLWFYYIRWNLLTKLLFLLSCNLATGQDLASTFKVQAQLHLSSGELSSSDIKDC